MAQYFLNFDLINNLNNDQITIIIALLNGFDPEKKEDFQFCHTVDRHDLIKCLKIGEMQKLNDEDNEGVFQNLLVLEDAGAIKIEDNFINCFLDVFVSPDVMHKKIKRKSRAKSKIKKIR